MVKINKERENLQIIRKKKGKKIAVKIKIYRKVKYLVVYRVTGRKMLY